MVIKTPDKKFLNYGAEQVSTHQQQFNRKRCLQSRLTSNHGLTNVIYTALPLQLVERRHVSTGVNRMVEPPSTPTSRESALPEPDFYEQTQKGRTANIWSSFLNMANSIIGAGMYLFFWSSNFQASLVCVGGRIVVRNSCRASICFKRIGILVWTFPAFCLGLVNWYYSRQLTIFGIIKGLRLDHLY